MHGEDRDLLKGHRDRLRAKYLAAGAEGMLDYERLELLLTYAIARRDVKPVAKRLLARFKTLSGVFDAELGELCEVEGLAKNSAILLKLVKSLCDDYLAEKMLKKDVVSSPEAVKNYLKLKVSGLKDEVFMVIYLDTKNQVISSEIMHKGTVDETAVYPRNILKRALELHASGMILVHNHPSGFSSPSDDDIRLTNAIREVVRTLNLRLLDHMVIAKDGCFSFVEQGML